MLYYLYEYLTAHGIHVPGLNLFKYISFRAGMAVLFSLLIALIYGKKIINYLRRKQMGELVRDLGLECQKQKEGTPTMGGLIIILATLIPVLLFTRITNVYIVLLIVSVLWMGAIGFIDDYLKKIKKNKDGLSGKFKIIGQVGLGLIVGVTMYFHPDITVKRKYADAQVTNRNKVEQNFMAEEKSTVSTVPFVKNNEFDYSGILFWMSPEEAHEWSWIVFIPIVIFIVTAVSNGANITDVIDGLAAGTSTGYRMGHKEVKDHMFLDGLEDADTGKLMGQFAQEKADERGYTREQMDAFAIESLNRALTADKEGHFENEIVPVTVSGRKGDTVVSTDEEPATANAERIPKLRAAFAKDGTITAANASSISDGAAAVVMMKESQANAEGLSYQARIIATASNSRHPSEFTLAPVGAMEKVLEKAGWSVADVDLWEINEAFAMVTMIAMDDLNIPHDKVNIEGGACALGHPVGCSGTRILVTLINSLQRTGGKKGVASLCIGGGEAVAVAIELA